MSTNKSVPPTTRDAGAPYADSDADAILRSSDGVDFRVHRLFLSKASPVFADMFALPSGDSAVGDELKENLHVIAMSEDEASLRILLGCCYPTPEPVALGSIEDAERAWVIADKFQFARPRVLSVGWFKEFADQNYERVFAFGWKARSREIVQIAALSSLSKPHTVALPTCMSSNGLADLPASAILDLFAYQRACVEAAVTVLSLAWFSDDMLRIDTDVGQGGCPLVKLTNKIHFGQRDLPGRLSHKRCPSTGEHVLDPNRIVKLYARPVMLAYMRAALETLKTHARGEAINNETFINGTYAKGLQVRHECEACVLEAVLLIPALAKLLASEVEKAIAQVPLELPF
ncbi:hypothetical protein PENSPDRAFT_651179, partial [Peniophora sp. CONT]